MSKDIPVLFDGGPVFVGPAWDHEEGKAIHPSLFFIYFKKYRARLGPFYTSIILAERDMKKLVKEFPQQTFWEQSLDWYRRQSSLHDWIDKNLGKPEDLIGGEWISEKK